MAVILAVPRGASPAPPETSCWRAKGIQHGHATQAARVPALRGGCRWPSGSHGLALVRGELGLPAQAFVHRPEIRLRHREELLEVSITKYVCWYVSIL